MKTKSVFLGAALMLSAFTLKAQWVEIPVVFHVLYENAQENLPDSVLQHQLDVLNEDFQALNADLANVPAVWQPLIGNMDIAFEFASVDPQGNPTIGIERRAVGTSAFDPHVFVSGGLDPWPDSTYINIWVYDIMQGPLGNATFPDSSASTLQCIDLDYRVVGRVDPNTVAPYNRGRVATHFMAHFFGLYHIWGDDGASCSGTDYVADTPNQEDENYGNPGVGTIITDQCSGGPGVMWMNFLDYTDDAAMCFFTQGQVVLVTNNIYTYYGSFLTPNGITPLSPAEPVKYAVFPSPSTNGIFQVNRVDYHVKTSVEVYDLQGRIIVAPEYFENGSTTMQVDLSGFANGTYSFVIRTENEVETRRVVIAR
jgi:hypothetical protein